MEPTRSQQEQNSVANAEVSTFDSLANFVKAQSSIFLLAGTIGLLSIFLSSSKDIYDELLSNWFTGCRIIISTSFSKIESHTVADVYINSAGVIPEKIEFDFNSNGFIIDKVTLASDLSRGNLLLHSLDSRFCPQEDGAVCDDASGDQQDGFNRVPFMVTNLKKGHELAFRVDFRGDVNVSGEKNTQLQPDDNVSEYKFQTLARIPDDQECIVERPSLWNLFSRVSRGWQIFGLTLFLLSLFGIKGILSAKKV